MKGWTISLLAIAMATLVIASPAAAYDLDGGLQPGTYRYERLDVEGRTTLKVEVGLNAGSEVTLIVLDQPNFLLFEADQSYQALHESTTMDELTVTEKVEGGPWYVVLSNQGPDEVQLRVDISTESGWSGGDLFISPLLLVAGAAVLAAVAVIAYIVLRKRKGGVR